MEKKINLYTLCLFIFTRDFPSMRQDINQNNHSNSHSTLTRTQKVKRKEEEEDKKTNGANNDAGRRHWREQLKTLQKKDHAFLGQIKTSTSSC